MLAKMILIVWISHSILANFYGAIAGIHQNPSKSPNLFHSKQKTLNIFSC